MKIIGITGNSGSGKTYISKKIAKNTGAKIINQLKIGKGTTVGAGAVVSKTLPENCTAVGIPAKVVKVNGKKVSR